jgi:organic radical activating enzyme
MEMITGQNKAGLPVVESFFTLQGEGYHSGRAAFFIRLGGCDVGCTWCDVKESWDGDHHPVLTVSEILKQAIRESGREGKIGGMGDPKSEGRELREQIAVVTGGEPLMHHCGELTMSLKSAGFRTHIETSGTHPLSGQWDWVCFSPKKFKKPLQEIFEAANELKVVVYNKTDFAWAEENAAHVSAPCKLFLQPEWSKSAQMTPLIIDYIKANPKWRFSLQLHKYIHVP